MKILLLSPYYYPNLSPRAHRWTALAEHWTRQGHEVHVITAKNRSRISESELNGVHLHVIGFNSLKNVLDFYTNDNKKRGEAAQKTRMSGGVLQKINDAVFKKIYFPDDAFMWYLPAKKAALRLCKEHDFDLLISSALPFTAHLVGLAIKNEYPNLKWIADTGDPFAYQPLHPINNYALYGKINDRLEKTVVQKADFVTLTNAGAQNLYFDKMPAQAAKFKVIPPLLRNGKDKGNADFSAPITPDRAHKISLAYFGSFFKRIREPRLLLAFFAEFLQHYPAFSDQIELHFFGNIFENFLADFRAFPRLKNKIFLHGMIDSTRVKSEMQNADFLLNVGNATDFQLPSKSVDYLASGKPIINFCSIKNDTFADFFTDYPLIVNVLQEGEEKFEKVRMFMEKRRGEKAERKFIEKKLSLYRADAIAERYLEL